MQQTLDQVKAIAHNVIDTEIKALEHIKQYIDKSFYQACQSILACKGKIVVIGMGKSGHIGHKIAATLASTGTPAFFVHPAEASHGDLGMLSDLDVVLAISNSGETEELVKILPIIKRLNCPLISMSGDERSTLAKESKFHICIKIEEEACPLGLAPTSSTTATLAMGDAIAITLLEAREFTSQDFALSHPAGSLGRKLLLRVKDLMHQGQDLPISHQSLSIIEALFIISSKGMGFTIVCDDKEKLIGVFTDGDLRRCLDKKIDLQQTNLKQIIKAKCITIGENTLAVEALNIMETKAINALVIVNDKNIPIGAINMHDLLKAKIL